uniref:Uncharacterized protein n=1 Tax=Tanacetum cinerariifolium TaxID=118510 RepID=A0A6L2M277_TANCI|nr:hypothetical protein [Tanacetum cinerariifolium]
MALEGTLLAFLDPSLAELELHLRVRNEFEIGSCGWSFASIVPGQMTYLVANLTLDSAKSCGGSISLDSFLPSILLVVVIVVTVLIVVLSLIFVVAAIVGVVIVVAIIEVVIVVTIIGVVIFDVVGGIPSIIKLSFMNIGSFSCYRSFTWHGVSIGIVSIFHGSSLCFQSCSNTIRYNGKFWNRYEDNGMSGLIEELVFLVQKFENGFSQVRGHHEKVKELVTLLELNHMNYSKIQKEYFSVKLGNSLIQKEYFSVKLGNSLVKPEYS